MSPDVRLQDLPFHRMLDALLQHRQVSARALAKLVAVDESHVRRWVRGVRLPPPESPHVRAIAVHLQLTPEETYWLETAHDDAVNKSTGRRSAKRRSASSPATQKFMKDSSSHGSLFLPRAPEERPPTTEDRAPDLRMMRDLLQRTIDLLRSLARPAPENDADRTILMTFQGHWGAFVQSRELYVEWIRSIREVLDHGWNVTHFWRLDQSSERNIGLISLLLSFLGAQGTYTPVYRKNLLYPPYDLLVVPGEFAVTYLATMNQQYIDNLVLTTNPDDIENLARHVRQMCLHPSKTLFETYNRHQRVLFEETIVSTAELLGELVLSQRSLSTLTRPESWYRPGSTWASNALREGRALDTLIAQRKRLLAACLDEAVTPRLRFLFPASCIERLVNDGVYDDQGSIESRFNHRLLDAEISEYLDHLISLVQQPHVEIAFADEEETRQIRELSWEVKNGRVVLMETFCPTVDGGTEQIDLRIDERTIAEALREHFDHTWYGNLSAASRDRRRTLELLHAARRRVEMREALGSL